MSDAKINGQVYNFSSIKFKQECWSKTDCPLCEGRGIYKTQGVELVCNHETCTAGYKHVSKVKDV